MPVSRKLLLGAWLLSCLTPFVSASNCTGIVGDLASAIVDNAAAQSFCSSKYPLPVQTFTIPQSTSTAIITSNVTVAAAAVTSTTTVATLTNFTIVGTVTTTVSTETDTKIDTSTTTLIQTATSISTIIVTITSVANKRDLPSNAWYNVPFSFPTAKPVSTTTTTKPSSTTTTTTKSSTTTTSTTTTMTTTKPPTTTTTTTTTTSATTTTTSTSTGCHGNSQICAMSSLLAPDFALASSVCSCIETTRTSTVSLPTTTVTSTTTATFTTTPTSISSVTATVITGVNATLSATATTTTTITTVVSITSTTTTISSVTATSTATVAPIFLGPNCTDVSNPNKPGLGGCSAACFCDARRQGSSIGVCDYDDGCHAACNSDIDCPAGHACAKGGYFAGCPSGTSCVDYTSCSSSYKAGKRMLERALGIDDSLPMRRAHPRGDDMLQF